MSLDVVDIANNGFQVGVIVVLLVVLIHSGRRVKPSPSRTFFTLALACFAATGVYWQLHLVLNGFDLRDIFSASDIAEIGMLLLVAAAIRSAAAAEGHLGTSLDRKALGIAVAWGAANSVLWAVWTGNWFEDLVSGVVIGVLVYDVLHYAGDIHAFSKTDTRILAGLALAMLLGEVILLLAPDTAFVPLDLACRLLWLAGIVYLGVRTIGLVRRDNSGKVLLGMAFLLFTWTVCAVYMANGLFWYVFDVLVTLSLIPMCLAFRRLEAAP